MIKQKSFNYKFNNNDNEFNFFVNQTNFYAFNALINNENKYSFLNGPKKSGKTYLAKIWLKKNNAIQFHNNGSGSQVITGVSYHEMVTSSGISISVAKGSGDREIDITFTNAHSNTHGWIAKVWA